MHKQNGFTLSEVLLTLVIIAVVAGLTVPTLIKDSKQMEYRAGYQRAINALNSALSEYNEGAIYCEHTGTGTIGIRDKNGTFYDSKFYPDVSQIRMKPNEQCFVGDKEITGRKITKPLTIGSTGLSSSIDLYNKVFREHLAIMQKNTNSTISSCSASSVYFYTADGMKYCIDFGKSTSSLYGDTTYGVIWVDVNGDKRPNKPPKIYSNNFAFFDQLPIVIMKNRFIPGDPSNQDLSELLSKMYFGEK